MSDKNRLLDAGSGVVQPARLPRCARVIALTLQAHQDREPKPIGLSARSLPDQVASRLLDDIIAGRLPAGTRLKEVALAQEHAVSRATIREALIALEKRRFVERIPRFGARVTALAAEDVFELFEVRGTLLGVAAARCAAAKDPAVLAELRELIAGMRGNAEATADPHRFAELSIAAQHLLLRQSGNRYLLDLYEQLAGLSTWRLVRTRALSFMQPVRRQESARDWTAVMRALSAGDPAAAESAARTVLQHSARGVRAQLAQGSEP